MNLFIFMASPIEFHFFHKLRILLVIVGGLLRDAINLIANEG